MDAEVWIDGFSMSGLFVVLGNEDDMALKNLRILIADDEPITRMDLRELLEQAGYRVVGEASDGFDTIELCRSLLPDLVLMDVKMPLLDGLSAARCIHDEHLTDAIVLLTAYSDPEFVENARICGVSIYMVKPVDERILIPNIELAVTRGREQAQLNKNLQTISARLEARKVMERAKGLLMAKNRMTEQEAFDYIRKVSREKNISMKRVAEVIMMRK